MKTTKLERKVLENIISSEFMDAEYPDIIGYPVWSFSVTHEKKSLAGALGSLVKKGLAETQQEDGEDPITWITEEGYKKYEKYEKVERYIKDTYEFDYELEDFVIEGFPEWTMSGAPNDNLTNEVKHFLSEMDVFDFTQGWEKEIDRRVEAVFSFLEKEE